VKVLLFMMATTTVVPGGVVGKYDKNKDPSFLDHNIDKHAIFTLPLSQGAYDFDVDGFVRKYR